MTVQSLASWRRSLAVLVLGFAAVAAAKPVRVAPKPEIVKIEIVGGGLTGPVVITDTSIVRRFTVWTGPGTSGGWTAQPRAFIDWPKREAGKPATGLRRYGVRFYWEEKGEPVYSLAYALDPRAEGGFVYLPGKEDPQYRRNVTTILHGVEGRWFHSAGEWEKLIRPYLK